MNSRMLAYSCSSSLQSVSCELNCSDSIMKKWPILWINITNERKWISDVDRMP